VATLCAQPRHRTQHSPVTSFHLWKDAVCEAQLLAAPAVGGFAYTHQLKGYRRNHAQSRSYHSNPHPPNSYPPPPHPKQAIVERQQSGAQLLEVRAEVVQSFAQKMESETAIIFHDCDCTLSFQIVPSQQPPHDDCLFSLECDFDPRCSARRSVLFLQSCQREIRVRKIPKALIFYMVYRASLRYFVPVVAS
jgi:hypothetical protein